MTVRILAGDVLTRILEIPDASVDSIVTDPPYHLTANKKGGTGPASLNENSPAGRSRVTTGFMGMKWDGGDIAFRIELWQQALRILKPGGALLAFSGSRTYHRMVCAIEDAGFEIRDQIQWIYGSGFPKSKNQHGDWEGWGTALKPAHEPIVLARKPFRGTVEGNLAAHGCGALNIDACRIGWPDGVPEIGTPAWGGPAKKLTAVPGRAGETVERAAPSQWGRWPANVIHDGSAEVLAAFPDAPGQLADASTKSEQRKTQNVYGAMKRGNEASAERRYVEAGGTNFAMKPGARRGGTGTAARFFYCAKPDRAERDIGLDMLLGRPGGMVSETSGQHITRRDGGAPGLVKNYHPTVKPVDLMAYLLRLVTPPGGTAADLFLGSGTTAIAAEREGFNLIGFEIDPDYAEIARLRITGDSPMFAEVVAE